MCAIAGAINYQRYSLELIKNRLLHRGPNEQSIYTKDNLALIHNRLSIQDIKEGHQPIHFDNYSIVFNGEIYNHFELRENLKEFNFKTNSDTETLLYLYIKYKEYMFEMIDGMFAFAIVDKNTNKLILARDRMGKKPLYYYQDKYSFLFASELNAIKSVTNSLEINSDAISAYLRTGFLFKAHTPYEQVKEIEAGSFLEVDLKTLKSKKSNYFDLVNYYEKSKELNLNEALESLEERFSKSVEDRLLSSDLEVGAFLSGGIDSNLVVAFASKFKEKLKTFTVKFSGAYDESELAKLTSEMYGTEHYEIEISMNLKRDLEKILLNYGEPFMDSSAIPSYYVSREAKKYVTVILNGDGADELFGGYKRYVPIATNLNTIAKNFSFLKSIMPTPHEKKSLYSNVYRLLSMSGKSGLDFYLSATTDMFEDVYKFEENSILNEMSEFINEVDKRELSPLSKMLYLDSSMLLFSDLLVKMDIATMANSLEGRSPFLSKHIVEFAPTLPDELKIKGTTTKFILRELAKKYLPQELITQPKRGFEVPLKNWLESDLKEMLFDYLAKDSYSSNFIEQNFVDKLLNKKVNVSDEKRAKMLWSMLCLEVWYKKN